MTPLKLNVFLAHFSYGGNGGFSSEHPHVRDWALETVPKMKADDRVGRIITRDIADTPITMTRNRVVQLARQNDCDLLLMIDSDMSPGHHKNERWFRPFWDDAFDCIYDHWNKGPLVVGAPYGGPPPVENQYVFQWTNYMNLGDETPFSLAQYTRNEAMQQQGIQECAALPTGLILYDIRAFDLIKPPYFQYEWTDEYQSEKASTEDVQNTRDISLAGQLQLGYNPMRCAWSAYAGHCKSWIVGRPQKYGVDQITNNFKKAVERGWSRDDAVVDLGGSRDRMAELGLEGAVINHVDPNRNGNGSTVVGIPNEIAELLPVDSRSGLKIRDIFGHKNVTFLHMTPDDHLLALRNFVRDRAIHLRHKPDVIEVGSWLGDSAVAMAPYCMSLTCVDNWEGTDGDWTRQLQETIGGGSPVEEIFYHNTKDITNISRASGLSVNIAKGGWNRNADIVFIDADHSYESTKADILAWLPVVKDGGVMIGHDYLVDNFPGVKQAVHEIFESHVRPYAISEDHGGFWVVEVNAETRLHAELSQGETVA